MYIVLLHNPDALPVYDGATEAYEAHVQNPFEGIEVVGVATNDKEANELIDTFRSEHPIASMKLKFHIDSF